MFRYSFSWLDVFLVKCGLSSTKMGDLKNKVYRPSISKLASNVIPLAFRISTLRIGTFIKYVNKCLFPRKSCL
jgi:hypothetical protein